MLTGLKPKEDYTDIFKEVIKGHIDWGKNNEAMAHCPFPDHEDSNPSFSFNTESGLYFCHGCNKNGHVTQLVKDLGLELHTKANVPTNQSKKQPTKKWKKHDREHIYFNEKGEPHLLIGIDGTGKEKKVIQYHWEDNKWLVGGVNHHVPYHLVDIKRAVKSNKIIFIVEGEKDADTLKSRNFSATTNAGGAEKWPTESAFNAHFKNAQIVILPDNDQVGKKHALKVASILKDIASDIKILELPDLNQKEDVTDWILKGHTLQDLKKLVLNTPSLTKEVLEKTDDEVKEVKKVTVSVFFDESNKFQPVWLGKYLLEKYPMFNLNGVLYLYENGVYKASGEETIKRNIQRLLGDRSRKVYIQEALSWLKIETFIPDERALFTNDDFINVKNGLLNWKTGELLPHTPHQLSTIQIPVDYDPHADTAFIDKFFQGVIPTDAIPTIEEMFGYCLLPTTEYQTAFMFTGEGSNGKSTVINMLTAFVGTENTTNISLQDLEKNRFKLAQLQGKLINTFSDLSHKALETSGTFKSIVAGDRMSAEFKGKDAFDFEPFARLVFSANEPPASRDVSKAYFRRWIIIPFPYSFDQSSPNAKKGDPHLSAKLKQPENLSALLKVALGGLKRLTENKGFTMNESTLKALEQYKQDIDNVKAFIKEVCSVGPGECVSRPNFYNAYSKWCHESGFRPLGKNKFNKRLLERCPSLTINRQYGQSEKWLGIGLNTTEYGARF